MPVVIWVETTSHTFRSPSNQTNMRCAQPLTKLRTLARRGVSESVEGEPTVARAHLRLRLCTCQLWACGLSQNAVGSREI